MKIFLHKLLKQSLLWAFLAMIVLDVVAYYIFTEKETVLAAVTTGSIVIFGYFATHYLTMVRNQRERKFEQCLELIKQMRFFILEEHIKGTGEQQKLRDEFQGTYMAFSLLTSEKSYDALSQMIGAFEAHLKCSGTCRCNFEKAQSNFVNQLRNEFFIDKEINFKTYDLRLSQDKKRYLVREREYGD